MKETLIKQIEMYSNSIVAFNVLQGITFSYYFGSSGIFNCRVHTSNMLAEILTFVFVSITILSIIGIRYIGKKKVELSPDHNNIISDITKAKICTVSIFGLFPAFLTFFYAVLGPVPKSCEKLLS